MKLLVSALEASANSHLEPLLRVGEYEIEGIFDKKFGSPLYPSSDFSVMGFLDVLPKIMMAKRAINQMVQLSEKVDRVLLIDSPAFNLPLAKAIKKRFPKKEIIYYILPQVWAWKEKRVAKVERYCDKLASIMPFETRYYNRAVYVGNPLLDEIEVVKKEPSSAKKVAFLPGSRRSEIKSLMRVFKETAKEIDAKKVLVIPKSFDDKTIEEFYGDIEDFEISRDTHKTLCQSDFAFVCSGTATLEAALIGVPFVLVYKAKTLDYWIAKRFVKLKYAGLANIILDFYNKEPLHKEFFQEDVNKNNLLKEYHKNDPKIFLQKAKQLRDILKYPSAKNLDRLIKK